jgi:hypothetical protein
MEVATGQSLLSSFFVIQLQLNLVMNKAMVQQQYSLQLPEVWTSLVSVASFHLALSEITSP